MIAWWRVSKRSHSRYSFRSIVSGINGESVRLYQPRRCIDKQLNTGEGCCSENAPSAAAPTDVASSHQSASQSALAPPTQQPRSNAGTFSLAGGARTVMTHIRSAATLREPGAGESLQRRAVSSSARAQPVKPTVPPTPGSVLPYAHHVLLRIAPPASHAGQTGDTWWPPVLERCDRLHLMSAASCNFAMLKELHSLLVAEGQIFRLSWSNLQAPCLSASIPGGGGGEVPD